MHKFEKDYFEKYEFNGKNFQTYSDCFSESLGKEFLFNVINKILKYKKEGKFLDVGCAEGFYLREAMKYFEPFGLDVSSYAVEKSKQLLSEFKHNIFLHSADSDWFFEKKQFDVILINHTIEHLRNPKKCLEQAFNCLKDDGILFIAFPTKLFELPKFIPNYKKTVKALNKWIYPFHLRNFRLQFGSDPTHISNPWPWNVANNSFLSPFFEPIEIFPEKKLQQLIAGGFEIIARKSKE